VDSVSGSGLFAYSDLWVVFGFCVMIWFGFGYGVFVLVFVAFWSRFGDCGCWLDDFVTGLMILLLL